MAELRNITLRDYQMQGVQELRAAYRSGFRAPLAVFPTGAGKCLGKGTKVLMFDGTIKAVEDVATGDLLMGPDSQPRRVVSTCTGREMLCRVTPTKGDPYVVNESHILSLKITGSGHRTTAPNGKKCSGGDVVNVSVAEYLTATKTLKHIAKGWRSGIDFNNPENKSIVPPYILGAWLGDGTSIRPEICSVDDEVIAEWRRYAESIGHEFRVKRCRGKVNQYALLRPTGSVIGRGKRTNLFLNELRRLGVVGSKHIPFKFKTDTRERRLELLAGILDTDGYLNHNYFDLVVKQRQLAEDIAFLARSLGLAAYCKQCRKTCTNTGASAEYYRISISGDVDIIPCRVPRRQAQPRCQKKNVLMTGIKVEKIGVGDYYGFEIEGPDRLFLLGDFTVTHNTVIFSFITQQAAARGNRVWILVHRRELLRQSSDSLDFLGVEHGLIAPGKSPTGDMVHVASVQTLVRRLGKVAPPDLIIIDEAHHASAASWKKVIEANPQARLLGVTATPVRMDGKGLGVNSGGFFDTMIEGPSIRDLIDRGFLSPPKVYAPPTDFSTDGMHSRFGDYVKKEISAAVDRPVITGSAVEHYRKICPNVPAIAFCASVAHAEHVAAEFQAAGFRAASVDGSMDDGRRKSLINALGSGGLHVLTSCDIISEGTDIPVVGAAIMLRPTQSTGLFLQQVGRALRVCPGKDHAVILDHVGNCLRHGMPDEIREWSLDGEDRKRASRGSQEVIDRVKQCERCYAVHPPAPKCPHCGFEYAPDARDIEQVDGELQEIDEEQAEFMRRQRRSEVGRARTLEDLQEIARERGYKPGWARHIWKARQKRRA